MNHGKFRKFGGTNSKMPSTEDEERDEEGGGSLMSKLEKFSGMWTDLDAAPVLVETKREVSRFQEEEFRFQSTENSFNNNWKAEDAHKKEIDNQKRVQSLLQRSETFKAQHSLINSALTLNGETKRNNRIVFDEDSGADSMKGDKQTTKKNYSFGEDNEKQKEIEGSGQKVHDFTLFLPYVPAFKTDLFVLVPGTEVQKWQRGSLQ